MPTKAFMEWVNLVHRQPCTLVEYFCEEESTGVFLTKEEATLYLSMRLKEQPESKDEHTSFLEHTAKALAIHMVFELDEPAATELFQKLKEPLSSRVFYYLTHLRGVYNSKL